MLAPWRQRVEAVTVRWRFQPPIGHEPADGLGARVLPAPPAGPGARTYGRDFSVSSPVTRRADGFTSPDPKRRVNPHRRRPRIARAMVVSGRARSELRGAEQSGLLDHHRGRFHQGHHLVPLAKARALRWSHGSPPQSAGTDQPRSRPAPSPRRPRSRAPGRACGCERKDVPPSGGVLELLSGAAPPWRAPGADCLRRDGCAISRRDPSDAACPR